MNPPSSEPTPDPDKLEENLESGILPPPQERTALFHRQQAVEETLRGLAGVRPPDPDPASASSWQHTVRHASLQQNLNDEGAAAAEAVISGSASSQDLAWWNHQTGQHPELAAAEERARRIDRTLAQLPEAAGASLPPDVLADFRRALADGQTPHPALPALPRPSRSTLFPWFAKHPLFASLTLGAAVALAVTAWNAQRTLPTSNQPVANTIPQTENVPPKLPPTVPERIKEIAALPLPLTPDPVVTPIPEEKPTVAEAVAAVQEKPVPSQPEAEPPPAGSLEALRPVFLAQLTGTDSSMGPGHPEIALRSGQAGAVAGTVLKLIYRSPGSTNLVDVGNETFPALASALTDPALADEPYFLVEDHSNNDLNVSLNRAASVCGLLTKLGVPASRLRAGGKGRFELRTDDVQDGKTSRLSIRPASARPRAVTR